MFSIATHRTRPIVLVETITIMSFACARDPSVLPFAGPFLKYRGKQHILHENGVKNVCEKHFPPFNGIGVASIDAQSFVFT